MNLVTNTPTACAGPAPRGGAAGALPGLVVLGLLCVCPSSCQGGGGQDMPVADGAQAADLSSSPDSVAPVDLDGAVDPGRPGPRRVLRFDLRVPITPTATLNTTVLGPTDDGVTLSLAGAPYPLVVLSPGFTLPRTQFAGYGERLASHGILAVLQTARAEVNHAQYRDDTIKLIDWLVAPTGADAGRLTGRVSAGAVGVAGHSLGGKISLLVAAKDPRIKAVIGIDPVDGGAQPWAEGVIATIALSAGTSLGLLGETVSKAGGVPCTPVAHNYEALYAAGRAPAFAITFVGAAHNDFVDDFASCPVCGLCGGGTAPRARTHDLAVKYVAAYFLRSLKGVAGAEDALSGAAFEADRATGAVTRQAK